MRRPRAAGGAIGVADPRICRLTATSDMRASGLDARTTVSDAPALTRAAGIARAAGLAAAGVRTALGRAAREYQPANRDDSPREHPHDLTIRDFMRWFVGFFWVL